MKVERIRLAELTPDPDNAKDHPAWQVEQIKASIEQFGNLDPIGVWGPQNLIVEGHGRYEALKELGYQEAEVIRLDQLTDEERRAYALAHNKLTMNSGWLAEKMDLNLDAIKTIDMQKFGFDPEIPNAEEKKKTTPEVHETSRGYIGGVSLFGHDADKIIAAEITPETAERLLQLVEAEGATAVQERLVEYLGTL